jgi:hypothetical protein
MRTMNPLLLAAPMFAALLAVPAIAPAPVSDPVGVYGLIDKVVLLPDEQKPTEAEIHGTFAVARGHGEYVAAPTVGCLWYKVGNKPEEAVRQWRELAKQAGTQMPIGFSSRFAQVKSPLVVTPSGAPKPAAASVYDTDFGLGLHRTDGADYGVLRELRLTPKPRTPAPSGAVKVKAGRRYLDTNVHFECDNCVAKQDGLTYVFEVEVNGRDRFASPPIQPGDKVTGWDARLGLDVGDQVRWSVRVAGGNTDRVPVATAHFKVEAE